MIRRLLIRGTLGAALIATSTLGGYAGACYLDWSKRAAVYEEQMEQWNDFWDAPYHEFKGPVGHDHDFDTVPARLVVAS